MDEQTKAQMAINSQAFLDASQRMLNEIMASYQMEHFNSVSLNMPMEITATSLPQNPMSQDQLWESIQQLYASQESLMKTIQAEPVPDDQKSD